MTGMTTARERPIQNLVFFERFGAEDAGASALVVGEEGFTGITEVQVPENGRFILIYRKDEKKRTKNGEIGGFFEKETAPGRRNGKHGGFFRPTARFREKLLELTKNGGIFI
jgi:hypothetical protein